MAANVHGVRGALNLNHAVEDAVLNLRDRIYVADGLVTSLQPGTCDSGIDGPHCGHAGVPLSPQAARTSAAWWALRANVLGQATPTKAVAHAAVPPSALLADGVLSSRLFGTPNGEELLDEMLLSMASPAPVVLPPPPTPSGSTGRDSPAARRHDEGSGGAAGGGSAASGTSENRANVGEASPSVPWRRARRKGREGGRARSALLSFRGLEPWRTTLPQHFAGTYYMGGGFPFSVSWDGPWVLAENPLEDNTVIKKGRPVAQLLGAVGAIRFGRNVHLQAIDIARPPHSECLDGPRVSTRSDASSSHVADTVEDIALRPTPPFVVRGLRDGREVFAEVVPAWELGNFVNGVAFTALTAVEPINEVVFLVAECMMIGAIQATISDDLDSIEDSPFAGSKAFGSGDVKRRMPEALLLTMREGWRAYGWEEVEFRTLGTVTDAPLWSLNEVVRERLTLRHGVFDEPLRLPGEEELDPDTMDEQPQGVGPEPLGMPPGLEEAVETGPLDMFDFIDTAMTRQRNASVLSQLGSALLLDTANAVAIVANVAMDLAAATPDQRRGETSVRGNLASVAEQGGGNGPPSAEGHERHPLTLPATLPEAPMLRGLRRSSVNAELSRLLHALAEAAEGGSSAVVGAISAGEAFDTVWRRLSLDALDTLLVRWWSGGGPPDPDVAGDPLALFDVSINDVDAAQEGSSDARIDAGALEENDSQRLATQKLLSSIVPGADVTGALVHAILRADDTLRLRVLAKNQKLMGSASKSVGAAVVSANSAAAALNGGTSASLGDFSIRIQESDDGDGVRVLVSDGHGREAMSNVQMSAADVKMLLLSMDPSGDSGSSAGGAPETGRVAGKSGQTHTVDTAGAAKAPPSSGSDVSVIDPEEFESFLKSTFGKDLNLNQDDYELLVDEFAKASKAAQEVTKTSKAVAPDDRIEEEEREDAADEVINVD